MRNFLYLVVCLLVVQYVSARDKRDHSVRVMSFNIRMDTQDDGLNQWGNRKDFACEMVRFHQPDLIGAQEVLRHQLVDMQQRLPEFATVGVGREDGKEKGEYCAIFYRKGRFQLLDQHTFWLSETPEAIGKKGWDAACERVVTWVKLKDKKSQKIFYFFNTHFDHMGETARRESCKLLKNKIREIAGDYPVVVTGDFNASPDSFVIKALTDTDDPDHLTNSRELALFHYGPEYSYHDYGRLTSAQLEMIDYIFVRNVQGIPLSAVITDTKGTLYVSDHYPLLAVINL